MKSIASWLVRYDQSLIQFVNCNWKCRFFDWLMPRFTHMGGATATTTILVLWFFFMPGIYRMWAIEGMVSLVGSHLVVRFLKMVLPRLRPYLQLNHLHTFPNPLTDYSFPSGHTTAAFSIATTFISHAPMLITILLPYAILVGFSRMYLALHYPTDVFIGFLIGSGCAWGTAFIFEIL
ncbi:phosphatase PAP2 family protein [Hazenella coriacea]|uniref:phosphatase PAP2 family protein n=1 Tax=Hazenella coriacea TaxID=1179467 RepID=UPI0014042778|nr:phosphatase PAP2 family protein [Hazenella coriacea]